ncbi:hypothetical protein BGZ68_000332 [Mortierella alpina]|nr:hypothetical protein BGZ68_000332 [Mortierella alpina]
MTELIICFALLVASIPGALFLALRIQDHTVDVGDYDVQVPAAVPGKMEEPDRTKDKTGHRHNEDSYEAGRDGFAKIVLAFSQELEYIGNEAMRGVQQALGWYFVEEITTHRTLSS